MSDGQTPSWGHLITASVATLFVGAGAGYFARGAVYKSRQQAVARLGALRESLVTALYDEDASIHGASRVQQRWELWTELAPEQLGMFDNFEQLLWDTAAYYMGDPATVVDVMIRVGYAPTKVPVLRDTWTRRIGQIPLRTLNKWEQDRNR